MSTPSFRDVEQVSAYLDGQLSGAEKTRLEARIKTDPALAAILDDLRQTRALLRKTPQRRAPRNFTLTPKMAGLRPPVPRLVPALSWASAAAIVLFLFTLGSGLIGQVALSSAAPRLAAAPAGEGGGPGDNTRSNYGIGGGPAEAATAAPLAPAAATQPFVAATQGIVDTLAPTPTPEASVMSVPQPTATNAINVLAPQATIAPPTEPVNPWPYVWLGLAAVLILAALLIDWLTVRAFRRKNKSG